MKKLILIISLICAMLVVGCEDNNVKSNKTELGYEELSKKEQYLFNVTGNNILMYNLKNLPKDKNYELNIVYEVYKNNKKVKEDIITRIHNDDSSEKIDSKSIIINLQEDKIRYLLGEENGYVSGSIDIDEKLKDYTQTYLTNNVDLELGKDVYIYHAANGESGSSHMNLGVLIEKDRLDRIIKSNEDNILIKLTYKEI